MLPRYPLDEVLERRSNNLDLVRLIAATMVLYSHAFTVTDAHGEAFVACDPFLRWLKYDAVYAASVGVKIFFFISGLLVTDSLLKKRDVATFLAARCFRIWPALIVVLLATTFVIGPLSSTLITREYLTHPLTYTHLIENVLLQNNTFLPGVFADNPNPNNVNLSLWSLAYEVSAYAVVAFLFAFGLLSRAWMAALLFAAVFVDPLLPKPLLFVWTQGNPHFTYLPICFAWGVVFALGKRRIRLGPWLVASSWGLFLALKNTLLGPHAFYLTLFVSLLYLSALPAVRRWRLPADPSYGIYLWGFVIQQGLVLLIPGITWWENFALAVPLAFGVGTVSWYAIERPLLRYGRRLMEAGPRQP